MCCTEIPTSFLLSINVSLDGGRAGVAVFLRDGVTGFLKDGVTVFLRAGVTFFLRDVGSGWRNTCTKNIKNECLCMGLFPVGTGSVFYGCF